MSSKVFTPPGLLQYYDNLLKGVTDVEFFTNPYHSKTQEIWCAANFAQGYNNNITNCLVGIDEKDIQTEADFDLIVDGIPYPFQITEVMEPGRKRGDEYKNNQMEKEDDNYDWGSDFELGPKWIRGAIEKKIQKFYSNSIELNTASICQYLCN